MLRPWSLPRSDSRRTFDAELVFLRLKLTTTQQGAYPGRRDANELRTQDTRRHAAFAHAKSSAPRIRRYASLAKWIGQAGIR